MNDYQQKADQSQADKFKDKVTKIDPFGETNYSTNFFNKKRETFQFDEKQLEKIDQEERPPSSSNKENRPRSKKRRSIKAKGAVEVQLSDSQNLNTEEDCSSAQVFQKSAMNSIPLSKQCIPSYKNVPQNNPCNGLQTLLKSSIPENKTFNGTIVRDKCFSPNSVQLLQSGQSLIKFNKINECLESQFEVLALNRQNCCEFLGLIRSNFSGSVFNVYEQHSNGEIHMLATISYSDEFSFKAKPRNVSMYIANGKQSIKAVAKTSEENLKDLYEKDFTNQITRLTSKEPRETDGGIFSLNMGDKAAVSSVNNTVLINEDGVQALRFYKIGDNEYNLKTKGYVSAFLGYCFALSCLALKISIQ